MSRLAGRVAVVTGGAAGIGFAIAQRLIAEGAVVTVFDISGSGAAAAEIGAQAVEVDVSDPGAMDSALQGVVRQGGGLHVLVNNAGIDGAVCPLAEYPLDVFDRVVGVNLSGVFFGLRFGIPHLLASGGGAIVNIASVAGMKSVPNLSPYCATKAAVIALSRSAAVEYSGQGIRVNVVVPGAIETPLLANVCEASPEIEAALVAQHPIGRFGSPAELAATVAFLVSDDAAFVTGATLTVDGGYSAT